MKQTAAAKIELIETALADGKYRTLQKQLRELKDTGRITTKCYLSNSHELLKAEAQRIIESLKPIAKTEDAANAQITNRPYGDEVDSSPYDAVTQNEFKQMRRIDLLPDEHPDRCVAVYYSQEPSPTINPEFFWFRDKVDGGVYEPSDCSWRFPLTVIRLLAIKFSSPAYHHSERFLREFDPINCGF